MKKTEIINTLTGRIRGRFEDGLYVFKGIPYAQPPIGDLRFKNPVQKEPWENILEVLDFGPISPQPIRPFSNVNISQSEDCLTLNIWTPGCDEKRRPVMLWIHGGGFWNGGSPDYDGRFLSQRGDVCIVTINYRLGALGNLCIPDKVSNLGFLDQSTALKWIYDNISYFGGNSSNITIFGESSGGTAVCTLLSMPINKPFIRRAISQSGLMRTQSHQMEQGIAFSEILFTKLGIKMGDIEALRKVSVKDLIATEALIRVETIDFSLVKKEISPYPPFIDGNIVLEHPLTAIKNGVSKNVDLMIGNNLNEWTFFSSLNPHLKNIGWDDLFRYIYASFSRYGSSKKQVEELINFLKTSKINPIDILNAIYTELEFRIPSESIAKAQSKHNSRTYMFLFCYRTPVFEGNFGATHMVEIPFIFGTLKDTEMGFFPKRDAVNTKLSEQMMDSWISFARTGDPNHENLPVWPKYDIENRYTILFNNETIVEKDPLRSLRLVVENMVNV